jgi:hypothetical protein
LRTGCAIAELEQAIAAINVAIRSLNMKPPVVSSAPAVLG